MTGSLKIQLPNRLVDASLAGQSALTLIGVSGLAEYSGEAEIIAGKDGVSSSETVQLELITDHNGQVVRLRRPQDEEALQKLLAWLSAPSLLSEIASSSTQQQDNVTRARSQILATLGFGLVAILLLFAISSIMLSKRSIITSQIAFVGLPGLQLDVHSSGRLEYVKNDGELEVGELFATIRSSRGNPVFVEAEHGGTIRQIYRKSGEFVRKGEPIAVVLNGLPQPFAAVFLKPTDAIPAIQGGKAKITALATGETINVALSSKNIVFKPKRLLDERGVMLTEIDIPLPQHWEAKLGEALSVEFDRDQPAFFGQSVMNSITPFFGNALARARQS